MWNANEILLFLSLIARIIQIYEVQVQQTNYVFYLNI